MDLQKSRGRKKNSGHTLETLDISKYIQTVLKSIDGQNYLIDEHGVLYKFDTYDIAGQVIKNEIIWF